MAVVDSDFYGLEVPPQKKSEYQEMCAGITSVMVAGDAKGGSTLFPSAKATGTDPYNFWEGSLKQTHMFLTLFKS